MESATRGGVVRCYFEWMLDCREDESVKVSLILFSGLPGCGKTTLARMLARRIGAPLLAKDRVQRVLRDHVAGTEPIHGYHLMLDLAEEQLGLGVSVILDAVFPLAEFRAVAREIAAVQGAAYRPIYCYCSDEALWRARMAGRTEYVPGWTPVGWSEVERLRAFFQPWKTGDALFVDALEAAEENLARVLAYVGAG